MIIMKTVKKYRTNDGRRAWKAELRELAGDNCDDCPL